MLFKNRLPLTVLTTLFLVISLSACADDPGSSSVAGVTMDDPVNDSGDDTKHLGKDEVCDDCRGEVVELVLKYNGSISSAHVVIIQKCPDVVIFDDIVQPGNQFFIEGADANRTMGQALLVHVNGVLNAKFHVSCSEAIGPGMVRGDFEIIEGASKAGGPLCPY